ncbi:DUF2997 domain-containing protein [Synechococcus sp. RSCCF101]|uniref:DUF2997 domain-containing protein n=1 Tax=Synechococcus sp. RSCCF101 TaxID=2511069 RepID=UPI0012482339|nr:DUF2997 domain-containing protein [Synechococcus sp. RSCCF101]QEY33095.1 DUF2997 domain-containing protein [Synechococcus sp. RSCCF101]
MPQRSIRFRIHADGRVEETVEGVAGPACHDLTERIEASLGVVQQRVASSEAFLQASESVSVGVSLSGETVSTGDS